ncbi:MAG: 3-oxo-tetronate kinase [Pseudomonadota bacterium]
MLLGCIADDITGATDLALMLAKSGMRTVQVMGVPDPTSDAFATVASFDAVVVALKSRTNPVAEAVDWSVRSCDALLAGGAQQIFFKYCSTFDSTPEGNIGPVADALSDKLASALAIVCPAFPANARSIYQGQLFVGEQLLSESPMKDHPLTPMRDASLVRVMAAQSQHAVGLVPFQTVAAGLDAVRSAFAELKTLGYRYAVTDAIENAHLMTLGAAIRDHTLITGGSGIAMGLAQNFEASGALTRTAPAKTFAAPTGATAILAGSCSAATRKQVAVAEAAGVPTFKVDPQGVARGEVTSQSVLAWAQSQLGATPVLIYSSDDPAKVGAIQSELGREAAGAMVEQLMADTARALVDAGVTRMIVAGGETSGAVAAGLDVSAIEIGPEIDPGVPWVRSLDARKLTLAFKSGNFGGDDFFLKSWSRLSDA